MDNDKLYEIAIETRNLEIGLFWQRSNYFLVLNTAVAVGFFSVSQFEYQIALSVFGFIVSFLWFRANLGSKYWQSRWEHRVSKLEKEIDPKIEMFSATKEVTDADVKASLLNHKKVKKLNIYDRWVLTKPSVSKTMSTLAALFICLWLAVFVLVVQQCR